MRDLPVVRIGLDELEAMRLCDVEGMDQQTAGDNMGISRGTIQRLLSRGRQKVVNALLSSSAIMIGEEQPK